MVNNKLHPLAASEGFKSNQEFYKKYPTQESYMQRGGQMNVQQNQALPGDNSVMNSFRNVSENRGDGYKRPNQLPFVMQQGPNVLKKTGGSGTPNNNYTNAGGIYSYQQGGQTDPIYIHAPTSPPMGANGQFTQGQWNEGQATAYRDIHNMNPSLEQQYQGFGNPMSDVNYNPTGQSGFGHSSYAGTQSPAQPSGLAATGFPTRQEAISKYKSKTTPNIGESVVMSDYNMHGGASEEMKKGGWIQKAINPAHKGFCTPMSKPTCTPHRKALAMRFKHGDLHKQEGGQIDEYQVGGLYHNQTNPNYGTFTPDGIRVAQMGWNGAPIPTANNLRGQQYGCPQDLNYQVGGLYHNQNNPNYGTYAPFGIRVAQEGTNMTNLDNNTPAAWQSTTPQLSAEDNVNGLNAAGPMPEQGSYASQQGAAYDETGITDQDSTNSRSRSKAPAYIGAGIGAGIGAVAGRNQKTRNAAGARMNQGMTSSQYPHTNPIGSKGDAGMVGQGYGQNLSHFGAGNVGSFYQPIVQQGMMVTPYQNGGMYQTGGEYELSDAQIADLVRKGYKIKHL